MRRRIQVSKYEHRWEDMPRLLRPSPRAADSPCIHRGQPIDRVACGTCVNSKAIINSCAVHGKATMHSKAVIDGVKRCLECADYQAPDSKTIALTFTHGLGDAANFAHMIPLYTRRGYRVQVHAGHADHAPVFSAGGAEIVAHGIAHRWSERGGVNKNANNLSAAPLPNIGTPENLWAEYCAVRLDFSPQVCSADSDSVATFLADAPAPIIALHVKGFSWTNGRGALRNYSDEDTLELERLLLAAMPGTIIVLDRDRKAPRSNSPRVKHFHDYSPGQLYELLCRSACLVGIDSGPLNFVRFTDTPAVGIWTNHHPADYLLPRAKTINVLANRQTDRDRIAGDTWNTLLAPDDRPSPALVADVVLRSIKEGTVNGLRATSFGRDYYDEHRRAGLDYLVFGDWHTQYGRWLVDSLGLRGKTLLDVGCACGAIARGLAEAGAVVQGIDINAHAIRLGLEKWPGMSAMLHVCDACNLHLYHDGEWDGLHSAQVAEHWPPHLVPIILRELARVTKPGGVFFCCLDTEELFARQGRKIENEDPTHVCIRSMKWWHEQLAAAGWEVTSDYDAALHGHAESFLRRYDWDWFVARRQ